MYLLNLIYLKYLCLYIAGLESVGHMFTNLICCWLGVTGSHDMKAIEKKNPNFYILYS